MHTRQRSHKEANAMTEAKNTEITSGQWNWWERNGTAMYVHCHLESRQAGLFWSTLTLLDDLQPETGIRTRQASSDETRSSSWCSHMQCRPCNLWRISAAVADHQWTAHTITVLLSRNVVASVIHIFTVSVKEMHILSHSITYSHSSHIAVD